MNPSSIGVDWRRKTEFIGRLKRLLLAAGLGLVMTGVPQAGGTLSPPPDTYREVYRPQFHFTANSGWLNDPNGLVYYHGEYHLFFQRNPRGTEWGNMTWGHALSRDLIHWRQLDNALEPDRMGTMFSGSAVVDWSNSAGFQTGREMALVVLYTAAGDTSPESKGQPFTQCLAYSNDRGRTWTKYAGNPVLPNIYGGNRDPKVFWHAPTRRWIMALYVDAPDGGQKDDQGKAKYIPTIQLFAAPDLKHWTFLSRIDNFFECPDLFPLAVDGATQSIRWLLFAADGSYLIGRFDGREFIPESGKLTGDWGANFYAAQTYSDIPAADGRRILIGWMRGGRYPGMPFNQQMTFPCELTLRTFPDGIRLCKQPVREIKHLYGRTWRCQNRIVAPGENPLDSITGDTFDVEAVIEPGQAAECGFVFRGQRLVYEPAGEKLACLGRTAGLALINGRLQLRLLLDRTSIEVMGQGGQMTMSSCFVPPRDQSADKPLTFFSNGGAAKIVSLKVHTLKSAWPPHSP